MSKFVFVKNTTHLGPRSDTSSTKVPNKLTLKQYNRYLKSSSHEHIIQEIKIRPATQPGIVRVVRIHCWWFDSVNKSGNKLITKLIRR